MPVPSGPLEARSAISFLALASSACFFLNAKSSCAKIIISAYKLKFICLSRTERTKGKKRKRRKKLKKIKEKKKKKRWKDVYS